MQSSCELIKHVMIDRNYRTDPVLTNIKSIDRLAIELEKIKIRAFEKARGKTHTTSKLPTRFDDRVH
jgi:hypothetical protein